MNGLAVGCGERSDDDLSFVVEWMQFRMVRTTARDKNPENPARTALAAPAGPIRLAQVTR